MKMTTKTLRGHSEGKPIEISVNAEVGGRVRLQIKVKGRSAKMSKTLSENVIFLHCGVAADLAKALSAFSVVADPQRNRE